MTADADAWDGKSTPSARWASEGQPDPHGTRYDCERAGLIHGELSDDEVANAVFMCDHRRSLDSMGWLSAAKDRIRWLSRALVRSQPGKPALDAMLAAAEAKGRISGLQEGARICKVFAHNVREEPGPSDAEPEYGAAMACVSLLVGQAERIRVRALATQPAASNTTKRDVRA